MCVSNRRYRFLKRTERNFTHNHTKSVRCQKKYKKLKLKITNQDWHLLMTKENKSNEDINEITSIENLLPILDKRQNSYKISANSMYGATGVRVGALPFMPIAMLYHLYG